MEGGRGRHGRRPIYTATHDAQSKSSEDHFRNRARGAKIGPLKREGRGGGSEKKDVENVSNSSRGERLEALDAWPEKPKKRLKRLGARLGRWWKGCRKQPPKAPFSAAFSQVPRL